jgi:hypothetical protein
MMKIAWLVWWNEDDELPELSMVEPDNWAFKKTQIVYTEVINGDSA